MDTKTAICLALGLGRMDTAALDEWARAWKQDITPALVEEAVEAADGRLDDTGDWLFLLVAQHAAQDVAVELGMDRYDYGRDDRRTAYESALGIAANGSASTVCFDGASCTDRDELANAARAWLDARAA